MITFSTTIQKFSQQGEKTGWTYILIPPELGQELKPGTKKSFRVKGTVASCPIKAVALLPMGSGAFIMPLNATMRKSIKKPVGSVISVVLEPDEEPLKAPVEFLECLEDEPVAKTMFFSLTKGHQNYFSKWIDSAKTEGTRAKRIAAAVNALAQKQDFATMLRTIKRERDKL